MGGKPPLLFISSYPTPNNGVSLYTGHYLDQLRRMGYAAQSERLYFLREKARNWEWIRFALRHARQKALVTVIQHTPTASGPLVLAYLALFRLLGRRVLVVSHETPSTYSRHLRKWWMKPAFRAYLAYERAIARLCSAYIVHTDLHRREMEALRPGKPVHVIPLPLYGAPPAGDRSQARYLGYYGQITPKKGVDLLLEAYQAPPPGSLPPLRIMGKAAPGCDAHFAGLQAAVRPEFRDLITFTGYVAEADKPRLFAETALMVFPYRWLTQSAALAEACAAHIPYLAADIPFFREFHGRYGCGKLFRAGDAGDLRRALEEWAKEPRPPAEAEFRRVEGVLSLERCAQELARLAGA